MSEPEALLQLHQGQYVPVAFNAGYVALSYLVSLVGAASTLELINRRTSRSGLSNHLLLISAAVTMGGIAIWCMVRDRRLPLVTSPSPFPLPFRSRKDKTRG